MTRVIKLESEILTDLDKLAYKLYLCKSRSDEFMQEFNKYIEDTCYTKYGNRRYRKGFIQTLHNIFLHFKESYKKEFIVFGYWYNDSFYTTYKNQHELTKKYKLKTTNELHDLCLDIKVWDSMQSGFYYADNLSEYFTNSLTL